MELLVVIAIIGLLASIILVSYKGSTDKARLAKTLSWAGSISHLLGDQAVGVWTFDNITGNTVIDDSGMDNNGTISGATVVDGVVGKALSFDGVNDYVAIPNSSDFNVQILTIFAWVKFFDDSSSFIFEKGNVNTQYSLFSHGTDIVFRTKPIGESYDTLSTSKDIAGITNNQWHFIVGTYDGVVKKLYVDGALILSRNWAKTIETNPNGSSIGRFGGTSSGYYFTGLIDDVRIFSEALPQARIRQLYVDGLATHQNLAANLEP